MKHSDGCRQKQHCCVFFVSARPLMAARSISGSFDADLWAQSLGKDFARQNVGKCEHQRRGGVLLCLRVNLDPVGKAYLGCGHS